MAGMMTLDVTPKGEEVIVTDLGGVTASSNTLPGNLFDGTNAQIALTTSAHYLIFSVSKSCVFWVWYSTNNTLLTGTLTVHKLINGSYVNVTSQMLFTQITTRGVWVRYLSVFSPGTYRLNWASGSVYIHEGYFESLWNYSVLIQHSLGIYTAQGSSLIKTNLPQDLKVHSSALLNNSVSLDKLATGVNDFNVLNSLPGPKKLLTVVPRDKSFYYLVKRTTQVVPELTSITEDGYKVYSIDVPSGYVIDPYFQQITNTSFNEFEFMNLELINQNILFSYKNHSIKFSLICNSLQEENVTIRLKVNSQIYSLLEISVLNLQDVELNIDPVNLAYGTNLYVIEVLKNSVVSNSVSCRSFLHNSELVNYQILMEDKLNLYWANTQYNSFDKSFQNLDLNYPATVVFPFNSDKRRHVTTVLAEGLLSREIEYSTDAKNWSTEINLSNSLLGYVRITFTKLFSVNIIFPTPHEFVNSLSITSASAGFKKVLDEVSQTYNIVLDDGISVDSATMDYNFYTAPGNIKMRAIELDQLIGGIPSDIFVFEVINSYDSAFTVLIQASKDGEFATAKDGRAYLNDASKEEFKTAISLSLQQVPFSPMYPCQFILQSQQRQLVYMTVTPQKIQATLENFQLKLKGSPVI